MIYIYHAFPDISLTPSYPVYLSCPQKQKINGLIQKVILERCSWRKTCEIHSFLRVSEQMPLSPEYSPVPFVWTRFFLLSDNSRLGDDFIFTDKNQAFETALQQ